MATSPTARLGTLRGLRAAVTLAHAPGRSRLGAAEGKLPPPDDAVVGVDHGADVYEPAAMEHRRRRRVLGERVRNDHAQVCGSSSGDQLPHDCGGDSPSPAFGRHGVAEFGRTVDRGTFPSPEADEGAIVIEERCVLHTAGAAPARAA